MELKKLLEEISVQADLLKELLLVFERETSEMSSVNIEAMNVSNKAKEELMTRIANSTACFKDTVAEFAVQEGLDKSSTLGAIADYVAKKGNRELLLKQQQVSDTADKIKRVAGLNHEIAERFAASVASSLNLITRLVSQSNVYGASGGYQQLSAGSVMINREA